MGYRDLRVKILKEFRKFLKLLLGTLVGSLSNMGKCLKGRELNNFRFIQKDITISKQCFSLKSKRKNLVILYNVFSIADHYNSNCNGTCISIMFPFGKPTRGIRPEVYLTL